MFEKDTRELLKKYQDGKATAYEKAIVEQWYLDNHAVNALADQIDLEAAQQKSLKALMNQINPSRSIKLGYKIAAAASVILVLGTAIYFYKSNAKQSGILSSFQGANAKNDIAPGINGATLTLADGRKIKLSNAGNGKLASEAGISITKTADGQLIYTVESSSSMQNTVADGKEAIRTFNTLSTSNGEQYQVILPDQTKVWLNASSSIKYPSSFAGAKDRRITLTGEAYFEVAKVTSSSLQVGSALQSRDEIALSRNASRNDVRGSSVQIRVPFLVFTKNQTIEVLGTHFNINSYENELTTKTTLLEGSVRVSSPSTHNILLKPGQQSILKGDKIEVVSADTEQEIAWKNGQFYFKNAPLQAVMRQISRWYNVEVTYNKEVPDQVILGGWISRSKKLSAILNLIELTGQARFKVEGRRVTVMP